MTTSTDLDNILREHEQWLDSRGTRGKRANLSGWTLSNVSLSDRDLSHANLSNTRLSNVSMRGINLSFAHATASHWSGIDMSFAKLTGFIFRDSVLTSATANRASFYHATLVGLVARDVDWTGSSFKMADLTGATLVNSSLEHAASLTETKLTGAVFRSPTSGASVHYLTPKNGRAIKG